MAAPPICGSQGMPVCLYAAEARYAAILIWPPERVVVGREWPGHRDRGSSGPPMSTLHTSATVLHVRVYLETGAAHIAGAIS